MAINVAIALGSNLGNSLQILENAIDLLCQRRDIELLACSSWYCTEPVGPPQPDYINGCMTCRITDLSAAALLQVLLSTEQQFGRERREHWGARTLDLDLILYGEQVIHQPHLQVPHPRMQERAFVLVPLAEIAADWVDPRSQQTVAQLKHQLAITGIQTLTPSKFSRALVV